MKELDWHKTNMDIVCSETANDRDLRYIYAVANAVRFILEQMHKQEGR